MLKTNLSAATLRFDSHTKPSIANLDRPLDYANTTSSRANALRVAIKNTLRFIFILGWELVRFNRYETPMFTLQTQKSMHAIIFASYLVTLCYVRWAVYMHLPQSTTHQIHQITLRTFNMLMVAGYDSILCVQAYRSISALRDEGFCHVPIRVQPV